MSDHESNQDQWESLVQTYHSQKKLLQRGTKTPITILSSINIEITDQILTHTPGKYHATSTTAGYVLKVSAAGVADISKNYWYISRRYSELRAFWNDLSIKVNKLHGRSQLSGFLNTHLFPKKHFKYSEKKMSTRREDLNVLLKSLAKCLRQSVATIACDKAIQQLLESFFCFPKIKKVTEATAVRKTEASRDTTTLGANSASGELNVNYVSNYYSCQKNRRRHRPGSVKPTMAVDISYVENNNSGKVIVA